MNSTKPKLFIGVDPGKSGAIAFLPKEGKPWTIKNSETLTDLHESLNDVSAFDAFAMLEKVHSMPRQGVSSTFAFGQSYGQLEALLVACQIPFERVTPMKWQTAMQCRTKGDKRISKRRAQELFPGIKITHANADALLLARYAQKMT